MERSNIQETSNFSSRFEDGFVFLEGSASQGVWYIDNGASTDMTRVREYFSSYGEENMDFDITMGNKMKCTLIGIGTIDFMGELGPSTSATNVLHVS